MNTVMNIGVLLIMWLYLIYIIFDTIRKNNFKVRRVFILMLIVIIIGTTYYNRKELYTFGEHLF